MDHEESLANINFDNLVLSEQTQAMKEKTATASPPVADKQRSDSGKKSTDKVVIGAESALERCEQTASTHGATDMLNDYTYQQFLEETRGRKNENRFQKVSKSAGTN
ncbi:uncharacterized protein LOC132939850 [Metopolophium dirhodum]|uniref:uncharacterized protein LOC132939844 n=1 Tax=Metopolophium dirhodum TaxID=44670 RepID=UPI00298F47A5|nr:uncharacterized protein LOC132939844 [Metopolophium dirhodum]XP_060863227.1 uncharacterized protein LOC132939845 [Metopolophium dirhodum]XP_060863231.1 uncharacterized protein LOC132939849 [Metopolophium dirhodum]XP_060863232.1 uncharacterized protein LOC132939850 [Metopolophium dirhodum]